jgi:hypothetical protein
MAIKGLTDRGLAFPEIGQIRKGAPKGERAPGKDLTYFRITFDEQEAEAMATFEQAYAKSGGKPSEINIILPFNEIERMWDAWLEAYTAGRMVARSDGEHFEYLVDTKTGEVVIKNGLDKDGKRRPYMDGQEVGRDSNGKPIKCKPTGRLKVILPELARAAYMTVLTTSIHDIANISAQLEAFKTLNGGQIAGIPLVLRRRPKKISTPVDGKRVRVTKWLISIEADPQWVKAKLSDLKHLGLPGNGLPLLPEPEEEEIEAEATWVDDEDDFEYDEPEPEPEPEPTPVTKAEYWEFVHNVLGWDAAGAKELANKHDGDYTLALAEAKKQQPPA